MPKRTIVIFSIFVVVSIIAAVVIYFYRGMADIYIDQYIAKITVCENIINETQCSQKKSCQGIYAPSCPDCQDLSFVRCQRLPLAVQSQLEGEKKLCRQTNGEWYTNKYGQFCLCNQTNQPTIFDKANGCVAK